MSACHFYLFSDGCPTDWLQGGHEEDWHTIAYLAFQSDPSLEAMRLSGQNHTAVLDQDSLFSTLLRPFQTTSNGTYWLKKWKTGSGRSTYRERFVKALSTIDPIHHPNFNAISFQEKNLRAYEQQLLQEFNEMFGGQALGFEILTDDKNRTTWRHSYVNWQTGFHVIERPSNQLLVLLFMARIIGDQFGFYRRKILGDGSLGFRSFKMTVISDRLSGDNDLRSYCEHSLRFLLSTDQDEITLTRSEISDTYVGDLLVDNLAGLLNDCIANPNGSLATSLRSIHHHNFLQGWNVLRFSELRYTLVPFLTSFLGNK